MATHQSPSEVLKGVEWTHSIFQEPGPYQQHSYTSNCYLCTLAAILLMISVIL